MTGNNGRLAYDGQRVAKVAFRIVLALCLWTMLPCETVGASETGITLCGAVVGPDDAPVAGLVVEAGTARQVTDEEGRFCVPLPEGTEVLLGLRGEAGLGRVKLDMADAASPVMLTYPVETIIVLLHDNDFHFNFNHRDVFQEAVDSIRRRYDNVFLFNAGDLFVRHADRWAEPDNLDYYRAMCAFIIDTMNEIGYQACTPGNHEFYYFEDHTRRALDRAQFPLLGANIRGDAAFIPALEPYVVFETDNGLTMAVLGLSVANFEGKSVASEDPMKTAKVFHHLVADHDLFVALTHIGLRQDRELARALPDLDVIIGGHSHNLLDSGEFVEGVLIGMAGGPPARHQVDSEWPKYLGKIKITFENDRIVEKTARVMTFGTPPTPDMEQ